MIAALAGLAALFELFWAGVRLAFHLTAVLAVALFALVVWLLIAAGNRRQRRRGVA